MQGPAIGGEFLALGFQARVGGPELGDDEYESLTYGLGVAERTWVFRTSPPYVSMQQVSTALLLAFAVGEQERRGCSGPGKSHDWTPMLVITV